MCFVFLESKKGKTHFTKYLQESQERQNCTFIHTYQKKDKIPRSSVRNNEKCVLCF